MTYNLELLRADVEDKLRKIARLEEEFAKAEEKLHETANSVPFYDRSAIGYILHNFYNGCGIRL